MLPNPELLGPASLAVGQSVTAFSILLPKFSDIRRADPTVDNAMVADVRMGEIAAVTVGVGVGVIISSLSGSPVPAFVSVVMVGILIGVYESALRSQVA